MSRDNFRFMDNFDMTVAASPASDSDTRVEQVNFGKWYCADRIVVCEDDNEFVDVHFMNGEVGRGIHKDLIELRGIKIEGVPTPEQASLLHKIFGHEDDAPDTAPHEPTDITKVDLGNGWGADDSGQYIAPDDSEDKVNGSGEDPEVGSD